MEQRSAGRPRHCRRVGCMPGVTVFKPAGVPGRELERVVLSVDEFEALRLADLEGLYHEKAAEAMGVSRPTFGRIVASARRKIAEVLVGGKALHIEGGTVALADKEERTRHAGTGRRAPHAGHHGAYHNEHTEQ